MYNKCVLIVAAAFMFLVATSFSQAAKPDCEARPDHPSCSDGGDGGDGGGEACSDAFPSFVFAREKKGNANGSDLMLASSEACRVEKLADIGSHRDVSLSYVDGRGLVAWSETTSGDVNLIQFTVDEGDAALPVTAEPATAFQDSDPSTGRIDLDTWIDADDAYKAYVFLATASSGLPDRRFALKVVDVSDPSTVNILRTTSQAAAQACEGAGPFDPRVESAHLCLWPTDGFFGVNGGHIYYQARSSHDYGERWIATLRIAQPAGGWLTAPSEPELVVASQNFDCVVDALPINSSVTNAEVGGVEKTLMVGSACLGIGHKGLRDQRLFFMDVEACVADPLADWQNCHIPMDAYSGQIHGVRGSWREDNQVIYGGFEPKTLETIRAFAPLDANIDDRALVSDAWPGDTSR